MKYGNLTPPPPKRVVLTQFDKFLRKGSTLLTVILKSLSSLVIGFSVILCYRSLQYIGMI